MPYFISFFCFLFKGVFADVNDNIIFVTELDGNFLVEVEQNSNSVLCDCEQSESSFESQGLYDLGARKIN